jgi:hypothetical protein
MNGETLWREIRGGLIGLRMPEADCVRGVVNAERWRDLIEGEMK